MKEHWPISSICKIFPGNFNINIFCSNTGPFSWHPSLLPLIWIALGRLSRLALCFLCTQYNTEETLRQYRFADIASHVYRWYNCWDEPAVLAMVTPKRGVRLCDPLQPHFFLSLFHFIPNVKGWLYTTLPGSLPSVDTAERQGFSSYCTR